MVTFMDAIKYRLIRVGLLFLLLAIILSLISMYEVPKSGSWSGDLQAGEHLLGDSQFEKKYFISNRTLMLYSQNASLIIIHGNKIDVYKLKNESVILNPLSQPQINIESGEVNYTYNVKGVDYPYAPLAWIAFVMMLVGSALSLVGYVRFMEELKGG
ncbi:hypothetical protein K1720_01600 [Thermococcus argininiproducens]|uniref:Uncharacterized protein n=1 Tax=Thermococcus argininiproducens TaxID=2866384 RepID=A0A9E7MB13_9EURY|nr:hypothetical protein [Thermococcus argininiproducens]USH00198.1 hypothetical protein K1720_01600 [Thermococcus argininiproducens]